MAKKFGLKKTSVYSLTTALLTGISLSLLLAGDYWLSRQTGGSSLRLGILGAFAFALVFQPLRDWVQHVIDRLFYQSGYNYQRILKKYSQILAHPMADLDRFAKLAPYLLWKSMKLAGASTIFLDRKSGRYSVRAGIGNNAGLLARTLPEDSALIREINAGFKDIYLADIKRALKAGRISPEERSHLLQIKSEMEQLNTVLVIPAISKSGYFSRPTLLATINLGKKLSGRSYSREDLDFLETIANQAAISIEYVFILDELKRNQAQVVDSAKLAALGATVASIAHELKNPLTYLEIVAQSMADSWDKPAFKESVIRILPSEVERMKLIIDGLSDYSKAHELRIEPVEITAVVDRTLAILGYEIKKYEVNVVRNYPAGDQAKPFALADKDRIVQVFMNIIANALQAIAAGKKDNGEPSGRLTLTVSRTDHKISVAISDTGVGIAPEHLPKVFDPFFTTKTTGAGLGLSITKKIVDEHKGSLAIDSRPGQGTTFTVCLPAA